MSLDDALPADLLLPIIFAHIYELPLTKTTFASLFVSKNWSRVFRHPLRVFIRGEFDAMLKKYPPSYYWLGRDNTININIRRSVTTSLGMTRQMMALEATGDEERESFVVEEYLLHSFLISDVTYKNPKITETLNAFPSIMEEYIYEPGTLLLSEIAKVASPSATVRYMKQTCLRGELGSEALNLIFSNRELAYLALINGFKCLSNFPDVERTEELCIAAVKINGLNLSGVPYSCRTEEICSLAVEQNGGALEYVPPAKRTKELCWRAIKQSGLHLAHVPIHLRSLDLCRAAVENYGRSLLWVPKELHTQQLCMAAVMSSGIALLSVPDMLRTRELYEAAVRNDGNALFYFTAEDKSQQLMEIAVATTGRALAYVPKDHITMEMCLTALKQDSLALSFVPGGMLTKEMCAAAVAQNGLAIRHVPPEFLSHEIYKAAVIQNKVVFNSIPTHMRTPELYDIASDYIRSAPPRKK